MNDRMKRFRSRWALVAGALALSACAGENLFSLAAAVGSQGPTVDITVPTTNFTIAVGDSILVQATVNATNGATSASYNGWYEDESAAYTGETETLNGVPSATLNNYLRAAPGQTAGSAYIVVEVTDGIGGTGIDSVKVTIN